MLTVALTEAIQTALKNAPRNAYVAELHLQVLKYSDDLRTTTGKEFCEAIGIGPAYGTEFMKMLKISDRLKNAGMDVSKI